MRLNDHKNPIISVKRSRDLRNNASPFERDLWRVLRLGAKQRNLHFRRQQPIHPFIADFACMEARLLIELDGYSHDNRLAYDIARDKKLQQMGYTILRFTNEDVKANVYGVVETILMHAENLISQKCKLLMLSSPHPNPPREGEGIPPSSLQMDF